MGSSRISRTTRCQISLHLVIIVQSSCTTQEQQPRLLTKFHSSASSAHSHYIPQFCTIAEQSNLVRILSVALSRANLAYTQNRSRLLLYVSVAFLFLCVQRKRCTGHCERLWHTTDMDLGCGEGIDMCEHD